MKLDGSVIGARIKKRRKELGITQIEVRESIGISSGNMSEIENGNRLPSASALLQLSNLLQCSVDWILTGKSSDANNSDFFSLEDTELALLTNFRKLPRDEQEEVVEIVEIKVSKIQRIKREKSSTIAHQSLQKNKEMA